MPSDDERRGLCRNCNEAPHCTFPRDPERPVIQCEEYRCDGPLSKKAAGKSASRPANSKGTVMPAEDERRRLCRTCDKTAHCTYPRSADRPIIQCDEFDSQVTYSGKSYWQESPVED